MGLLLSVLRGQGVPQATDAEWGALLTLAEGERVLPSVAARLRQSGDVLPASVAERLAASERDAAIAAFYWTAQLKQVLHSLSAEEIETVALKGPMLAERLYGNAALRVCRDLDLLVARRDVDRAERVLAAAGYELGEPDDYHRPWHRQGATVELHYDVENPLAFDFHVEGALKRSQLVEFHGKPCRIFTPEDELLYLCLHAARHRYDRMSVILDLQLAFERLPGSTAEWTPRPGVSGLDPLLALGLAMAQWLAPGFAFAHPPLLPKSQAAHLDALAERLWHKLMTDESKTLDWAAAHAFFVEIEMPGWPRMRRRLRHLRILQERLIEPDVMFAARFGLRRPWQARVLRPLRLLSEAVAARFGRRRAS
jgi:hypothetical protein